MPIDLPYWQESEITGAVSPGGGVYRSSVFFLCFEILGSLFHFAFVVFGYLFSRLTFSVLGFF